MLPARGATWGGVRDVGGMRGAELCTHASRRSKGGGLRLTHKWREAWRRGPFTERGRGMVFKASTPHDHGVGRGRFTRRLGPARLPRSSHALGVANGGGGKPGRRGLGRRVGPSSLRLPRLDWLSGAAEPSPRSFIKSGRGNGVPHSFISSFLQLLLPPSICHGERESWSFNGGGEGRRSTTRPSFSCTCGGGASREGKGEGARPWARPRRSGKRRTGRHAGLASASSSSPYGGPCWG